MLNAIPFVGWFLSAFVSFCLAVPFWFIWTVCGIGETYAYWLPPVYRHPGFWACLGIFMVVSIIKSVFVPKLVSVSNDAKMSKSDD
jgi:hypothetical protein